MLAGVGSLIGIAGAVGYAALIMYGLRTWWVGAVGTTALELHVDPLMLLAGVAGARTRGGRGPRGGRCAGSRSDRRARC